MLIQGNSGKWEIVIGLEVHAQVTSEAKLFSGAATEFGAEPNTQVSLVDAAMPGMLPVINRRAVEQAVKTGLGLKAGINKHSVFDRKNYFYPDLPQGYQISQYLQPIVGKGEIVLDFEDGSSRAVGITRLHLEQDAGKSLHDQDPRRTYVDLNRSGVALMEIVSEPDMRSPEEAGAYLAKMRSILRYLGTCDGNMEEGSMRADVNVSVRPEGTNELGTRCEIKNVNSIRFVRAAIEYEAARQVEILEDGGEIEQQTRLFDADKGETRSMRSKEEAHDYRYFPDPDLLPLEFDDAFVAEIRATLPELPDDKKARFIADYGLKAETAATLVLDKEIADEFERKTQAAAKLGVDGELYATIEIAVATSAASVANFTTNNVIGIANSLSKPLIEVYPNTDVEGVVHLVGAEVISSRIAKDVLEQSARTGKNAAAIVDEQGLQQVTDTGAIEAEIDKVIASAPDQVAQFKDGNDKILGWFVGQIMKATQGKANPAMVNEILRKKLG